MNIKIYQINPERDKNKVMFASLEDTEFRQESSKLDPSIYDRVFTGDVDCEDLEEVYKLFNTDGHRLNRGHSLSVSDIIEVESEKGSEFYFCDSIGFKPVSFKPEKAQASDDLIRVLVVEPNRVPYESEIVNTLEGQQKAVEGLIEYLYNDDDTIIVLNEEGKLNGMEGNRRIEGDVLAGPFFIAGDDGEKLCSLTDEQLEKYTDVFAEPEDISPDEIESHTGYILM